jgi:uncharacterized protein (TIGR02217 family)
MKAKRLHMTFHDIRFPTAISLGASSGGPERRTDIVVLGSGHEERNQRWADSRRRYEAGYGVKSLDDLQAVIAFFEERRGRLHGFRWKDHADYKSCVFTAVPTAEDQPIGTGDGATVDFRLIKRYGASFAPWLREITKPVIGTVKLGVGGAPQIEGADYFLDYGTGIVTFDAGSTPGVGAAVTAGFEFDVPVRFDTDRLTVNLDQVSAGSIPSIPILEIRQ